MPPTGPRLVRFGVFEMDLDAGELRKNGGRIRLQEQPFQVLAFLLEREGLVITREEFREKIWPADTFVDFDHSLNTAVNKIREALGDSAASPRFVETIARRGYRFIAPVNGSAPTVSDEQTPRGADSETALHPELHVPVPRRSTVRVLFALIQIMYLAFYLSALYRLHKVDRVAESFLPGRGSSAIIVAVLVTGAIGIPLRFYLISAVAFDFRRLGEAFRRLFPFILALDELWGIAPFLLTPQIGIGMAFAATAALLYVPFAERTLVRMGYDSFRHG
jgi:DNA-binding winged helix-turn-helix (wHTH) protein